MSTRDSATSLSVLIVDEDVGLARTMAKALRRSTEEIVYVKVVASLDDATTAMRTTHFDVMMVNVDGPELPFDEARLEHALTIAASGGGTAVVAVGHNPSATTAAYACNRGAQDYLCVDVAADLWLMRMLHCASERSRRAHQMSAEVYRDELTGLANRRLLRRRFAEARYSRAREAQTIVLLMIDLDGFKAINDVLGHSTGDRVLIAFAERLGTCTRESDVVARVGGDEFVVLACCEDGPALVEEMVRRIAAALLAPVVVAEHEIYVRASIGTAMASPEEARDLATLLEASDAAMYRSKTMARG